MQTVSSTGIKWSRVSVTDTVGTDVPKNRSPNICVIGHWFGFCLAAMLKPEQLSSPKITSVVRKRRDKPLVHVNNFLTQISIVILPRTLFPRHSGDNVQLAVNGVLCYSRLLLSIKICIKVKNRV